MSSLLSERRSSPSASVPAQMWRVRLQDELGHLFRGGVDAVHRVLRVPFPRLPLRPAHLQLLVPVLQRRHCRSGDTKSADPTISANKVSEFVFKLVIL